MTGRAAGSCAGYPVPGYANSAPGCGYGRGYGRGGGRGMAWRRGRGGAGYSAGAYGWAPPPATPADVPPEGVPQMSRQQERKALEQQLAGLQSQLSYLQERLEALNDTPEPEDQPAQ